LGAVGDQEVVQGDLVRVAHGLTSRPPCHTLYDTSYTDYGGAQVPVEIRALVWDEANEG